VDATIGNLNNHFYIYNRKELIVRATLLTLLGLILTSCNCHEIQLTPEEKAWCAPYKQGETVIFRSNLGNHDSLEVMEKTEDYTNKKCSYTFGSIQQNTMRILLKPNRCHNNDYCEGEVSIIKMEESAIAQPFLRIFGLEYELGDELLVEKLKLTTTNKIYNSAYFFKDSVNATNYGNTYLKSFHWDKKDGLIRYEGHNGEVFELLKVGNIKKPRG
jgi:hypothetical protein